MFFRGNENQPLWDYCWAVVQEDLEGAVKSDEAFGLEVSMDGVRPARKFLKSISTFPRPETISNARAFFGMINQVSYVFSISPIMEPLIHLIKPDS